ncbi:hypothetical protein VF14_03590 [Nostoc linckia z18]|uniref:Uncharacterized protein n=2 Tax=Nostoc linckia TaxID=92942 RepID=A0A9Q6ENQ3_NOSLI|nr:hypothetical protein [Nostoc linckia]PHK41458.1 hypothetical protein VF12_06575 [Nostoc linckia z15]PHK46959.1 hypothetical protein VF13_08235 [Nostoc linckia z16]PHJ69220.1 hypothetical protein VF02_01060 [Nostoc linckia z1]PHJ73372.1 hypothetical protein VF05_02080 [Nostoc linckia z3]PHJ78719.1 hypothetical protein VF03_01065 [Nostoc linckia z2]
MLDRAAEYLNKLVLQILQFIGIVRPKKYRPPIIKSEYRSTFCRLLSLESNTATNVAIWRAILQYTPYDLLFTCDRLQRSPTRVKQLPAVSTGLTRQQLLPIGGFLFAEHPFATHQIAISRISRYPVNNQIKVECLGLWHLDLVGVTGIAWSAGDRFAVAVAKSLAFDLLENHVDDLDWTKRIDTHARKCIGDNHNAIGKLI